MKEVIILKYTETCGYIIDSIKNKGKKEGIIIGRAIGRGILNAEEISEDISKEISKKIAEAIKEGIEEGITIGSLNILNALVTDSNSRYTAEELAEKFGFTSEQILNYGK